MFNDRQPDVPGNFSDDLPTHHLHNACFRSIHPPQWCKTTAVVIHKPSRADRCQETAYTTERSRSLSALPFVHSARKFDVHGLATDAGAYDHNFPNCSIFEQTCQRNKYSHQHEKALGENGSTRSPEVR